MMTRATFLAAALLVAGLAGTRAADPHASAPARYWVCVSNERSGTVTVIDGTSRKAVATIEAGKRPRGIPPSPDGTLLYVALSGSPIHGPPALDGKGNPIFPDEDPRVGDRT